MYYDAALFLFSLILQRNSGEAGIRRDGLTVLGVPFSEGFSIMGNVPCRVMLLGLRMV
ncbi:hypothetical protein [Phaeobacter sp. J2-8]|uniref:hypothetical protein n=1 Tax=Phaeobacter sp. J2-8 TaxID=2931394 RepID=UPI001FD5A154|nr:hypothetical protein [Phaeobacter sp. J2-8]MCJ7874800.1 hypothetical protein [Phaeobacter sp. J2-8]